MMQRHHSRELSAKQMLAVVASIAIVASDTDLDHAIMEICLRVPGAGNRRRITLYQLHGRISVFT